MKEISCLKYLHFQGESFNICITLNLLEYLVFLCKSVFLKIPLTIRKRKVVCPAEKEGYNVLRLIEHNQFCYVSSEYVEGCFLPEWLKYHPNMEKEEFFYFVHAIVKQLSQIHRCRGNPCYRYVNPYSILVSKERKVYFLDINAESGADQVRLMQRRVIREYFLPPQELYYQTESFALDLYGLGKTIQYMLSQACMDPPLSKREELRFHKILSRCLKINSKKSVQDISEILKIIPKYKKKKEKKRWGKKALLLAAVILVICISGKIFTEKTEKTEKQYVVQGVQENQSSKEEDENRLNKELGLLYFLSLEDYKKSDYYFSQVKEEEFAENMALLARALSGQSVSIVKVQNALEKAEAQIADDEENRKDYYECLIKGYVFLGEAGEPEKIIQLGKSCLEDPQKERTGEIMGYMAMAYERQGEKEKAIEMYEKQLGEEASEGREVIYAKTAQLFAETAQPGKAQEMLREGIEEFPQSEELRIAYIRIQLEDPSVERGICIENISRQLGEFPELGRDEAFRKMMKEYGISVKGESVWQEE